MTGGRAVAGLGWSAAYTLVSRGSTLAAVPLVLAALGEDLYAVWVVAGVLVMSQGLIDLGMGAALVRFVSVSTASGARDAVETTIRRAAAFYLGLSVLVGAPMWVLAERLVGSLQYIQPAEADDAAALLRYAVAAFVVTNFTMICASALQGMDRVDAAFRGQAIGWAPFVPVLAVGFWQGHGVHAIGAAWLIAYALQAALTAVDLRSAVRRLEPGTAPPATIREMLSLGGRWQISGWADFATFQLPRLLAVALLGSAGVVAIDLALRYAQLVVMPVFVALPLVLPRATAAWMEGGREALARYVERFARPSVLLLFAGAALAIPLAVPAIAVWSGRPMDSVDPLLAAAVLVGVAAHASTGVLSSALLATGEVRPVIVYKYRQLAAAAVLGTVGASLGSVALGAAVGAALLVPAVLFNRTTVRTLGVASPIVPRGRELLAAIAAAAITAAAVSSASTFGAVAALACGAAVAAVAMIGLLRLCQVAVPRLSPRGG